MVTREFSSAAQLSSAFAEGLPAQLRSAQENFDPVKLSSAQLSEIFQRPSSAQLSSTKILQIYNSVEKSPVLFAPSALDVVLTHSKGLIVGLNK